jgi:hypothetical protein
MKRKARQGKKFFCTECGTDLDTFCFAPNVNEYADILKHHFECQRTGKFKGSMCSKLFIVESGTTAATTTTPKLSAKKLASLKASVMQKIEAEEARKR